MPSVDPGNTLNTAYNVGALSSAPQTLTDFVGSTDFNDYYRFTLASASNVSAALRGLSGDADLQILDSSGAVVGVSSRGGAAEDAVNQSLAAGVYYVQVSAFSPSVNYTLNLSAVAPSLASNLLPVEVNLGTLTATPVRYTSFINSDNTADVYRFALGERSNFNASLTGLSVDGLNADIDLRLIRDANNNGIVDSSDVLIVSEQGSNRDEAINAAGLAAGSYFVQAYQYLGASGYSLQLSATPPSPTTQPSNLLPTELNVGNLSNTPSVYSGILSEANAADVYRITVGTTGSFNLSLSGLGTDIDVRLIRDANNNGVVDAGEEVARSQQVRTADEAINLAGLAAGTYFVQVYEFGSGNSGYTLRLSTAGAPANLLPTEADLGVLGSTPVTISNTISSNNTSDLYRFSLSSSSALSATLGNLSADLDLRLIRDANNNGVVDAGEELARSALTGTSAELITTNLSAGTYFLQVYQFSGNSSYSLSFSAAPPDLAGNTLATARAIAIGATPGSFTDFVGSADPNDYYRFTLAAASNFNLALTDLSADADVQLLDAAGSLLNSSIRNGTANDTINHALGAGTYYIRVYAASGNTFYNLNLVTTPPSPTVTPNPLLAPELNLGTLTTTPTTVTGGIGTTNTSDVFQIRLAGNSNFVAALTGLSADADLRLIRDVNSNGIADAGDEVSRSQRVGALSETLSLTNLVGGLYFVQVYRSSGSTTYSLALTASPAGSTIDPGNTLATAEVETSPVFSRTEQVRASDRDDFYRFTVGQSGIFTANLTGLTGDADVRLIRDGNSNGVIDQGEVLAWQWERGTGSESIRSFLSAGTYFMQVMSYNNQTANYSVATNFTAAATDNRQFSIAINFAAGAEGLSAAMRTAVLEAARFWENVISYSSFNGAQTLTIDVGGREQEWTATRRVLASAGFRNLETDAAGRSMPTSGIANVNTNPNAVAALSADINYFRRVMIHEFGHVLGIGTLWDNGGRNLISRTTGTYNATTYAGWEYGELRGTFTQTAAPLTTGVGLGSDYGHWSEDVFRSELMTYRAEAGGNMPLSQLTIASLRDIGWNVNYGAAEPYSLPT